VTCGLWPSPSSPVPRSGGWSTTAAAGSTCGPGSSSPDGEAHPRSHPFGGASSGDELTLGCDNPEYEHGAGGLAETDRSPLGVNPRDLRLRILDHRQAPRPATHRRRLAASAPLRPPQRSDREVTGGGQVEATYAEPHRTDTALATPADGPSPYRNQQPAGFQGAA
jgi:hypothetical protein